MSPHQPKNRLAQELPVLTIQVVHAHGVAESDPNGIAASAYCGATGKDLNNNPEAERLRMRIIRLKDLEPVPGAISVISGQPALLYRAADVEIPLSREEMHRLFDHSLEPDEYFALLRTYGMFYEIHDDYYDTATGAAIQPITALPLR